MTYKITKGPRGRQLFFKDGKMISKKDIPEDVLAQLEPNKPVDDSKPEFRKCIFCGQHATERKLLNSQTIDLCLHHYQNKTTGAIAQKLRETPNG